MTNNIVLAISANCTRQIHIMLYSIFYNNRGMNFRVYFLYFDIPDEEIRFYKRIIRKAGHECSFIKAPPVQVAKRTYSHITNETFLRLLIPAVLPQDVDRALYLDFDIVVNGSLKKIFQYPFGEYSLIASEIGKNQNYWRMTKKMNEVPYACKYFNAGMLMMNLEKLRKDEHFKRQFIYDYLENHLNEIREDDQGYLNHFLCEKTKVISNIYNYDAGLYAVYGFAKKNRLKGIVEKLKKEKTAEKKAIVIHYCGRRKPWNKNYNGQCARVYREYTRRAGYPIKCGFCFGQNMEKIFNIIQMFIEAVYPGYRVKYKLFMQRQKQNLFQIMRLAHGTGE